MPDFDAIAQLFRELAVAFEHDGSTGNHPQPTPGAYHGVDWDADEPAAADDPWAEPAPVQESRPAPARSTSQGAPARRQEANGGPPVSGPFEDNFGRTWTFGKPGAPQCEHGETAAHLKAKSKAGKPYQAWVCPKGYGDTWRDKCDTFEFIGR